MNKKGQFAPFELLLWFILLIFVFILLSLIPTGKCKENTYILKGVNGITDENSGLLSGGDVSTTSLLMQSGEIITVKYRIPSLFLNKPITIRKCRRVFGNWVTKVIQ